MTFTRVQQRRATAAEWQSANPVLADGEIGYVKDSKYIKVGDGSTSWNSLPPLIDPDLTAHIADTVNAHAAEGISFSGGSFIADNVKDALLELETEKSDTAHTHAAQTATTTSFTPTGNIAATNVQAALAELDAEKSDTAHTHGATGPTFTKSAGFPSFAGRTVGDYHYNDTTGRMYIITGTPGGSINDTFNRANGSLGSAYAASSDSIVNNRVVLTSGGNASNRVNVGSGPQSAEITFLMPAYPDGNTPKVSINGNNDGFGGYYVYVAPTSSGPTQLYIYNGVSGGGGVNGISVGFVATTGRAYRLGIYRDATTIYVYFVDTVTGQRFDYSVAKSSIGDALNGVYIGFGGGNNNIVTAFSGQGNGTLAWSATSADVILPATPSAGLTKSTIGSGLPAFSGRLAGDMHYEITSKKEYVLSGTGGASVSDNFNRANGNLGTSSSGATWTPYAGTGPVISGEAAVQGDGNPIVIQTATGGQEVSVDWSYKTGAELRLLLVANGPTLTSYAQVNLEADGRVTVFRTGPNVVVSSSTALTTQGYTPSTTRTDRVTVVYNGNGQISIIVVANGVTYNSGVLYTDPNPLVNNTYAGFYMVTSGTSGIVDNFDAFAVGTLSWKLTSSNQEVVNTVASSGAAQTLPDPDTASISRITLSANCTLTFPTAAAGKSFTVVLVQDATGSRTVTWPGSVMWPGGTAPTLTTTASKRDVFTFLCADGTNWLGFTAGQNY